MRKIKKVICNHQAYCKQKWVDSSVVMTHECPLITSDVNKHKTHTPTLTLGFMFWKCDKFEQIWKQDWISSISYPINHSALEVYDEMAQLFKDIFPLLRHSFQILTFVFCQKQAFALTLENKFQILLTFKFYFAPIHTSYTSIPCNMFSHILTCYVTQWRCTESGAVVLYWCVRILCKTCTE